MPRQVYFSVSAAPWGPTTLHRKALPWLFHSQAEFATCLLGQHFNFKEWLCQTLTMVIRSWVCGRYFLEKEQVLFLYLYCKESGWQYLWPVRESELSSNNGNFENLCLSPWHLPNTWRLFWQDWWWYQWMWFWGITWWKVSPFGNLHTSVKQAFWNDWHMVCHMHGYKIIQSARQVIGCNVAEKENFTEFLSFNRLSHVKF